MIDIESLIRDGHAVCFNCGVNSTNSKLYPIRLQPQFQYISSKYDRGETLTAKDIEFLTRYTTEHPKDLTKFAYVCDQFVEYKSHSHKTYNLIAARGPKIVKKCKNFNSIR